MLIRNIDENLRARLRVRAAEHGRSMEEEVRTILRREPWRGSCLVPSGGSIWSRILRRLRASRLISGNDRS
jgi:hypothetical protein